MADAVQADEWRSRSTPSADADRDRVRRHVLPAVREEVLVSRSPTSMPPPPVPMMTPAFGSPTDKPGVVPGFTRRQHAEERGA